MADRDQGDGAAALADRAVRTRMLLRAYIANQTMHWFIVGILTPVLILLIMDKGLSLGEAGIALAVYSATTIVLELPTGGLADSIGRKRVYVLSLVVTFCGLAVLLVSTDFVLVSLAMFLNGVGRALSSGSIDAWFVDEFRSLNPNGDLQKAISRASTFVPLGLGMGALVGGALPVMFASYAGSLGGSSYDVDIIAMMVLVLAQGMLTQKFINEPESKRTSAGIAAGFLNVPAQLVKAGRSASRDRTVAIMLLVGVAFGFALVGLELLWQPRLSELLGGGGETWVFGVLAAGYFMANSMGYVVAVPFCRAMKNDHPRALFVGFVAFGLLLAVLAVQTAVLMFALIYLLVYMSVGLLGSPFDTMFNLRIQSADRSTMLSFLSLAMQTGGLVGNLVLGFVASASSISIAWLLASAVILLSSSAFLYLAI
ncbi:MAG TPA: MFS transporter, partial [Methanomassiliicoccales archaeon]|nr:MFS transporter [Methanomassiliicoccales archaeon]